MTRTSVPCPRSTLEGRRAPRPYRLWSMICRRLEISSSTESSHADRPILPRLNRLRCSSCIAGPRAQITALGEPRPSLDRLERVRERPSTHARARTPEHTLCEGVHGTVSAADSWVQGLSEFEAA